MTDSEDITMQEFQLLAKRAGLSLSAEELDSLKPMYDYYAERAASLHDLDLDVEDLAVTFSPDWAPRD